MVADDFLVCCCREVGNALALADVVVFVVCDGAVVGGVADAFEPAVFVIGVAVGYVLVGGGLECPVGVVGEGGFAAVGVLFFGKAPLGVVVMGDQGCFSRWVGGVDLLL